MFVFFIVVYCLCSRLAGDLLAYKCLCSSLWCIACVPGLLVTGVVVICLPMPGIQAFVFFIAGFICFIPGAYHVVYIYWAVKGKRGYDFYHLPLFN